MAPDCLPRDLPINSHARAGQGVSARFLRITTPEANAAHDDLMQLNLELFCFDPFADRIWELRHTVAGYDAWYVALAEAFRLSLATLDAKLSKAKGPTCDFLIPRSS